MPETPSVDFFDKYKDSSEMAEPSQKRQHMEVEQQEEEEVFDQDDEEGGRFFGGGLTSEQNDILDLVDQYDAEEVVMTIQNSKYIQIYPHFSNRQRHWMPVQ